jgi:hypothetical protein
MSQFLVCYKVLQSHHYVTPKYITQKLIKNQDPYSLQKALHQQHDHLKET